MSRGSDGKSKGDKTSLIISKIRNIISEEKDDIPKLQTGIFTFDVCTGGIPLGRISVFAGEVGSGKTTMALAVASAFTSKGWPVLYVDTERTLTKSRVTEVGVDTSYFLLTSPETVEELNAIIGKIMSEKIKSADSSPLLIVWDSIPATPIAEEIEDGSDYNPSLNPRRAQKIYHMLRRYSAWSSRTNTTFLVITQYRVKLDEKKKDAFRIAYRGASLVGGLGLFYTAMLVVEFIGYSPFEIKSGKPAGITVKFVTTKTKGGYPSSSSFAVLSFKEGFSNVLTAVEFLQREGKLGEFSCSSGWFSYEGRKFRKVDFVRFLVENEEITDRLIQLSMEKLRQELDTKLF